MRDRGVATEKLFQIYELRVRSLLEYLAPCFTGALTQAQIRSIERVQKRYFRCILGKEIFKNSSYIDVCKTLGLETLQERRNGHCVTFVKRSLKNHPGLFPTAGKTTRLNKNAPLLVPNFKKRRYEKSARLFLPKLYNSYFTLKGGAKNPNKRK